jgi:hypothetical protein
LAGRCTHAASLRFAREDVGFVRTRSSRTCSSPAALPLTGLPTDGRLAPFHNRPMNDCILGEAVCKEYACFSRAHGRYEIGRRVGLDKQHLSRDHPGKGKGIVQTANRVQFRTASGRRKLWSARKSARLKRAVRVRLPPPAPRFPTQASSLQQTRFFRNPARREFRHKRLFPIHRTEIAESAVI